MFYFNLTIDDRVPSHRLQKEGWTCSSAGRPRPLVDDGDCDSGVSAVARTDAATTGTRSNGSHRIRRWGSGLIYF